MNFAPPDPDPPPHQVFRQESQPVIDALKDSGRGVGEIDAQGSPDEVFGPVADFMAKFAVPKGELPV